MERVVYDIYSIVVVVVVVVVVVLVEASIQIFKRKDIS